MAYEMDYVRNHSYQFFDGTYLTRIVAAETPSRIYAFRIEDSVTREAFLTEIRDRDQSRLHHLLEEEIFRGSLVLVNISDQLFRGVIQDNTSDASAIRVWLGDYAFEVTVALDELYIMPPADRTVHWQVFVCGIVDIQPFEGTVWSTDTCEALQGEPQRHQYLYAHCIP